MQKYGDFFIPASFYAKKIAIFYFFRDKLTQVKSCEL